MAVAGGDAAAMVDLDQIAVAAAVPAGAKHGAVGGRVDRRAVRAGEVDAGVHRGAAVERIGADAEAAGERTSVLTGLSDGMAITPSCSWSSFFQLLNSALKVGLPALSNGPPTPSCADAGRADAELLQLGGGDLVADVERLGDERRLRKLLLLDAGKRAVVGDAAAVGCRGDELRDRSLRR